MPPDMQTDPVECLAALVNRLRPSASCKDPRHRDANLRLEIARLIRSPAEAGQLGATVRHLLALPDQSGFYAESGVRSALGFWLEFADRLGQKLLPPRRDDGRLRDVLWAVLRPTDGVWIDAIDDALWCELARVLGLDDVDRWGGSADVARANVLDAIRVLSFRLAGASLDSELLLSEPSLERVDSPFLAQNAALEPLLQRWRDTRLAPDRVEVHAVHGLLDHSATRLTAVRQNASERGISVRLTYHVARLQQLIMRLRELVVFAVAPEPLTQAVRLMKVIVVTEQARDQFSDFVGENLSLVARNVTEHAGRRGEHYIAEDRSAWWAMGKSAAGGGVVIAVMAVIKVKLSLLHLPPLTEGLLFGASYAAGFVLIHLLGLTVATKQPAMTAAAIAATVEDSPSQNLGRLTDLTQNVLRTQNIAVLGNVFLAVPVAVILSAAWAAASGEVFAPPEKAEHLLAQLHPFASGSLFFAAVAAVGLFLSGLVSGYFDNQARYRHLAARIAAAPALVWLGSRRAAWLGAAMDQHYGAVCGNVFFGMYLGLLSALGPLTGLPVDIRHVAFSSANVGIAVSSLGLEACLHALPWAMLGVALIGLVNLAVSFALALFVAMKSRGLGAGPIWRLVVLLTRRFARTPGAFFRAPT